MLFAVSRSNEPPPECHTQYTTEQVGQYINAVTYLDYFVGQS
jgi:hypothetical protein